MNVILSTTFADSVSKMLGSAYTRIASGRRRLSFEKFIRTPFHAMDAKGGHNIQYDTIRLHLFNFTSRA